jgi:uncharacterized protein (DUF433 family)
MDGFQWKFLGPAPEGEPFSISGIGVWEHPWIDTKERVRVKDPRYEQEFTFHIYTIDCAGASMRFAAGEFPNGIFGFYLPRITVNPNVCNGKPVICGTRISVQTVLEFLAAGNSIEEVLEEYPSLTREDVQASIGYGSHFNLGWS